MPSTATWTEREGRLETPGQTPLTQAGVRGAIRDTARIEKMQPAQDSGPLEEALGKLPKGNHGSGPFPHLDGLSPPGKGLDAA